MGSSCPPEPGGCFSGESNLSRSPNQEDVRVSSQGRTPLPHSPHTQGWDWRSWRARLGSSVWPAPAPVAVTVAPIPQGPCGSWEGRVADFSGLVLSALGGNPDSAPRILASTQVRSVAGPSHCWKDSPHTQCLTTVEMDGLAVLEVGGLTRSPWANLGLRPGCFFLEAQEEKLFPFPASRDTCTPWPSAPSCLQNPQRPVKSWSGDITLTRTFTPLSSPCEDPCDDTGPTWVIQITSCLQILHLTTPSRPRCRIR